MMKRKFFGLLLVAVAGSTHAGDGVLEINAACRSSSCFAGDDPGSPIEITQPGSYRLTSNLQVNQNTGAIVIEADDVNLDLNGYSILGPVTCSGNPVTECHNTGIGDGIVINGDRAAVRNGNISGMGRMGIFVDRGSGGHRLADLNIGENGGSGIFARGDTDLFTAPSALIRDTEASRNGGSGVFLFLSQVYVYQTLATGNGEYGQGGGWCRGVVSRLNGDGTVCTEVDPNQL